MLKKITFLTVEGHLPDLIKCLTAEMGFPTYTEELVIYLQTENNFKIVITDKNLLWTWRDENMPRNSHGKNTNKISTNLSYLKEKVIFLCDIYNDEGIISTAKVYKFLYANLGVVVEIKINTLIGSIITISFDKKDKNKKELFHFYIKLCTGQVLPDTFFREFS